MQVFDAIRTRLTVREFKPDAVPDEVVDKLLRAGQWAASSRNLQPWRFIVITDRDTLSRIGAAASSGRFIADAPLAIAIAMDSADRPDLDTGRAMQQMELAAWEMGLGTCFVGLRGVRIKNIVDELQGEKIDVLEWDRDISQFIANALNPARVVRVELDYDMQAAMAVVQDRHLSLAIGKEGQNARLAAKLTGWNVDIKSFQEAEALAAEQAAIRAEEWRRRQEEERAALIAAAGLTPSESSPEEAAAKPAAERTQAEIEAEEAALMAELEREQEEMERRRLEHEREQAEILAALEAEEAERKRREEEEEAARQAAEAAEAEAATPSLRDLPEDVWTIPTARGGDAGGIRFAEDIAGLRGGVTVRRSRRAGVPIDPNAPAPPPPPPARGRRRRGRGGPPRRRR